MKAWRIPAARSHKPAKTTESSPQYILWLSVSCSAPSSACCPWHKVLCGAGMEEANGHGDAGFNFEREIDSYIPVEVTETRLTGQQPPPPQLLVHLTGHQVLLPLFMDSEKE